MHRRDTEFGLAPAGLRNCRPPHRLRLIVSGDKPRADAASTRARDQAAPRQSSRRCQDFPHSVERASMHPEGWVFMHPLHQIVAFQALVSHTNRGRFHTPDRSLRLTRFVVRALGPSSEFVAFWPSPSFGPSRLRCNPGSAHFSPRRPRAVVTLSGARPDLQGTTLAFAARPARYTSPRLGHEDAATRSLTLLDAASIQLLFVGSQLRSPLPSRWPRGSMLSGSLRSL